MHRCLRDPVAGELVGMQETAEPGGPRPLGELSTETDLGADLGPEASLEPAQTDGQDVRRPPQQLADRTGRLRGDEVAHRYGGPRCDIGPLGQEPIPDPEQDLLPFLLQLRVAVDRPEVLDPLDLDARASVGRDVEVLPDGPDPRRTRPVARSSAPISSATSRASVPESDLGTGGDLDEWDPERSEPVPDAPVLLGYLPGGVLLQTDRGDRVGPIVQGETPVDRDEGGALEPGRVGPIHDDLAHHFDLVDRPSMEQSGHGEGEVERLRVERMGRLLVQLDETGGRHDLVLVHELPSGLERRGRIDQVVLPARRVELAPHLADDRFRELGRAGTEQLVRRQLLVHLEAGLHELSPTT